MNNPSTRHYANIHNAADIRLCARFIDGKWIALSCDIPTATQQILSGDTDSDVQFSPYMDDREELA